ncbi:VWA domain-containing protein [Paenibacillus sp. J22TS3]|uniref:VWA domain-containing protein n=1 Tax=Paenibacillus sp. J22TS3 TaxID=2807192 RepID=UPI001B2AE941|nr:VWA domain-containing protein [Paenibacillus sp. J22TS3]GIP22419.1 VWA domain-containing protein [Paenibacillus sp. J22TS3]
MKHKWMVILTAAVLLLSACTSGSRQAVENPDNSGVMAPPGEGVFRILSSSENKSLEPLLKDYADQKGYKLEMVYEGSVDSMYQLQRSPQNYDGVWLASSLWISMGDTQKKVRNLKSVMTSPVVWGIRKSKAKELGLTGREVGMNEILSAVQQGRLRFSMTSASQSNSGASAYIGMISAFSGSPETITGDMLKNPNLRTKLVKLLAGVERSSGSSGFLKDMFLEKDYPAMVNYESVIIETNQELIKRGREPLYVVYPKDGLTLADYSFGFIQNDTNKEKEKFFQDLQGYLLSEPVQARIQETGRRVGLGGMVAEANPAVFNPDWGIDTTRILTPIKFPDANVILEALNLYQSEFRKPSYTVYCLDFSGSMQGDREHELKSAMEMLLDQNRARDSLLQGSAQDVITILPFSSEVTERYHAEGADNFKTLLDQVNQLAPDGGTDIYSCSLEAVKELSQVDKDKYIASAVLMTDGESSGSGDGLAAYYRQSGRDIPVFSIAFGEAASNGTDGNTQLTFIKKLTNAELFDSRKGLAEAFKKVRGYN